MSRRSSADVLGGIGAPSGVRKPSRRPAALFSLGLKPRMPSRTNAAFIRLTIRLRAPVLARYGDARCVDDVGLNAARAQPARQPEAVTASLEGDYNAFDTAPCFLRFLPPSMQQLQQCALVDRELLQRLALDARHDAGNEPARQAHLYDRDQRAVRFEGGEGSAQVVQLLHGALHRFTSATMDAISSPPPHSIFHHGIRGRGGTISYAALPSE